MEQHNAKNREIKCCKGEIKIVSSMFLPTFIETLTTFVLTIKYKFYFDIELKAVQRTHTQTDTHSPWRAIFAIGIQDLW